MKRKKRSLRRQPFRGRDRSQKDTMDGRHIEPEQTLLPEQRSALIIRWHDLSATDRQQMLQEIDIERRGTPDLSKFPQ